MSTSLPAGQLLLYTLLTCPSPVPVGVQKGACQRSSWLPGGLTTDACWQVMVPGRTHISLAVAWALDHDPVAAVQAAANRIPEEESVDLHVGDPVAAPESTSGHSTPNQQGPSPGGTPPTSVRKLRAAEEDLSVEPSSLSMSALEAKKRRDEKHRCPACLWPAASSVPLHSIPIIPVTCPVMTADMCHSVQDMYPPLHYMYQGVHWLTKINMSTALL